MTKGRNVPDRTLRPGDHGFEEQNGIALSDEIQFALRDTHVLYREPFPSELAMHPEITLVQVLWIADGAHLRLFRDRTHLYAVMGDALDEDLLDALSHAADDLLRSLGAKYS